MDKRYCGKNRQELRRVTCCTLVLSGTVCLAGTLHRAACILAPPPLLVYALPSPSGALWAAVLPLDALVSWLCPVQAVVAGPCSRGI